MVSSRSPGASVTCNDNSTSSSSTEVPNNNDLEVRSSSTGGPVYNLKHVNEPEKDLSNGRSSGWNSESGPSSFSMSIDLNHATSGEHDSGSFSTSPDRGNATSSKVKVTLNNEVEERYEGFGAVEGDYEEEAGSPGGSSSAPSPTGPGSLRNPRSPNSTIGRHSWLRTSLRRTPSGTSRKRLSSNALASQLYRSSSFNSSGRGSICDTTEDMYSDVSLEDDVLDLNHRSMCLVSREKPVAPRLMVEKSSSGSTDRGSTSNCKNCPNSYQHYNPCESYYHHPPPPPRSHYPPAYQAPCPCQSTNRPSDYSTNEVEKIGGSSWLPIFLFILLTITILIVYNFLRGFLSNSNANIPVNSNPAFLLNQSAYPLPIGAQTWRIRRRDASQNCPAEFVCCNNHRGVIIEPREEESPHINSPQQSMSPQFSVDQGRKTQRKNTSIEASHSKLSKPEEASSSNEKKKSSGTFMTDDDKIAFLKKS